MTNATDRPSITRMSVRTGCSASEPSRPAGTLMYQNSGGMTLVEMANVMRELGAWDAMNFDGGGSTTMVVDGIVVNHPSDKEGERQVGNAILIVLKAK